jgi:hypothetical protein
MPLKHPPRSLAGRRLSLRDADRMGQIRADLGSPLDRRCRQARRGLPRGHTRLPRPPFDRKLNADGSA